MWQRVLRIDTKGLLTTAAGNGTTGYGGDSGDAASAAINSPGSLATDANGNLYIADTANFRVRLVNRAGVISTFAGIGTPGFFGDGGPAVNAAIGPPAGLAVDGTGNLYISDPVNHRIRIVTTDGKIRTFAGTDAPASNGDGGQATVPRCVTRPVLLWMAAGISSSQTPTPTVCAESDAMAS
jgi:sugar lactone lactonase YvrE